jgi:hypothetical protein
MKKEFTCVFMLLFCALKSEAQLSFPKGKILDLQTQRSILYKETEIRFYTGIYKISDYEWTRAELEDSLDPRWDFQACFNGDCKVELPPNGDFIPDFGINDTTGFIAFHIDSRELTGKSKVAYYVINKTKTEDKALLIFNITYINFVGINESFDSRNSISVYPNPASDVIILKSKENATIEVFNMINQQIAVSDLNTSGDEIIIPTAHLANGMYFLKQGMNYKTFVVKH